MPKRRTKASTLPRGVLEGSHCLSWLGGNSRLPSDCIFPLKTFMLMVFPIFPIFC